MGKGRTAAVGRPPKPVEDDNWKIAPTAMPATPSALNSDAQAEWDRIEKYLIALNRVASIDRQALASYCMQWGHFVSIAKELSDPDVLLYTDGPNCDVVHPLLPPLLRDASAIIQLAGLFGMTARTRDLESDHGNRKASALKRLMGNQRKIAESKLAPSVIPMLPEFEEYDLKPPSWMSVRAKNEFYELGEDLQNIDLFTPLDVVPLSVVCVLFDLFLRSHEQLKTMYTEVMQWNEMTQSFEVKYLKEHPLHRIQTELQKVMHKIWKDYGQTPRYRKVFNGERKKEGKEVSLFFPGTKRA